MGWFIFGALVGIGVMVPVAIVAYKTGRKAEGQVWDDRMKVPVAGQRVFVKAIGEVFILGLGDEEGDGIPEIYYVSEEFLNGRLPSAVEPEDLDANTVSVPKHEFIAQIDYFSSARA